MRYNSLKCIFSFKIINISAPTILQDPLMTLYVYRVSTVYISAEYLQKIHLQSIHSRYIYRESTVDISSKVSTVDISTEYRQ